MTTDICESKESCIILFQKNQTKPDSDFEKYLSLDLKVSEGFNNPTFKTKILLKERSIIEIITKDGANLATYNRDSNTQEFICDKAENSYLILNPTNSVYFNTHSEYYYRDFACNDKHRYQHTGNFIIAYYSYGNELKRYGEIQSEDCNFF